MIVTGPDTPAETVLALARFATACAAAKFIVSYAAVRWEDTPEGRNLMALAACLCAVSASGFVRIVLVDHWAYDAFAALVWFAATATLIWRDRLRSRAEKLARQPHREHEETTHDGRH